MRLFGLAGAAAAWMICLAAGAAVSASQQTPSPAGAPQKKTQAPKKQLPSGTTPTPQPPESLDEPPLLAPAHSSQPLIKPTTPAGRRGTSCSPNTILLAALGPDRAGYGTASETPRVFWYLSDLPDADCRIQLTLMCDPADPGNRTTCPEWGKAQERVLSRPRAPGMQEINFSSFSDPLRLREGILFRWYISIERPAESRSQDDVDGAFISKVPESADDNGTWYDQLAAAYDLYRAGHPERLYSITSSLGFRRPAER